MRVDDTTLHWLWSATKRLQALVGDIQGGSNNPFQNVYNVKAAPYNAKGDGITDDGAAIQAADNAAALTGGIVYFPPGVYAHMSTLTASPKTIWQGPGFFGSFAPPAYLKKTTLGNGLLLGTVINATTNLGTQINNLGFFNSFVQTVANWQAGHNYNVAATPVGTVVAPAPSSVADCYGPNNDGVSPIFLKLVTQGVSGTYQPIGQLLVASGTGAVPPTVTLSGAPSNDNPLDVQILNSSGGVGGVPQFQYSVNRGTSYTGPVDMTSDGPFVLTGGYSVTFSTNSSAIWATYLASQPTPIFRTPSMKWSLYGGTLITDGGCVWQVVDAGGGIVDLGGAHWSLENVWVTGYNIQVICDQSEEVTIDTCYFGAGNLMSSGARANNIGGVWMCGDSSHIVASGANVNAVSGATNDVTIRDTSSGANGFSFLDDGGLKHLYQICNCEGSGKAYTYGNPINVDVSGGDVEAAQPHVFGGATFFGVAAFGAQLLQIEDQEFTQPASLDATGFQISNGVAHLTLRSCGIDSATGPVVKSPNRISTWKNDNVSVSGAGAFVSGSPTDGYEGSLVGLPAAGTVFGVNACTTTQGQANTDCDVAGQLATRQNPIVLVNGANNDVNLSSGFHGSYASYCKFTGPTGAYSVTGFAVPVDGAELDAQFTNTGTLTLAYLSASSAAGHRVSNPTGADLVFAPGNVNVKLKFDKSGDSGNGAWEVFSYLQSAAAFAT